MDGENVYEPRFYGERESWRDHYERWHEANRHREFIEHAVIIGLVCYLVKRFA